MKQMHKMTYWIAFVFYFVSAIGFADEVTLMWDPNSEPDLAGYRMFVRQQDEVYDYESAAWDGVQNTCEIDWLDKNESYYFVVRAYNYDGRMSGDSNEAYLPARNGNTGGCFVSSLFEELSVVSSGRVNQHLLTPFLVWKRGLRLLKGTIPVVDVVMNDISIPPKLRLITTGGNGFGDGQHSSALQCQICRSNGKSKEPQRS